MRFPAAVTRQFQGVSEDDTGRKGRAAGPLPKNETAVRWFLTAVAPQAVSRPHKHAAARGFFPFVSVVDARVREGLIDVFPSYTKLETGVIKAIVEVA